MPPQANDIFENNCQSEVLTETHENKF